MSLLTKDEIQRRIAERQSASRYRYVRSLSSQADSLIETLQAKDGEMRLGLAAIDVLTRGFRPTDLVVISGFAHSGKTQIVNTMILASPHKRILFFSLDDPAPMLVAKLVAMQSGISSERIEQHVRAGDVEYERLISEATDAFPNLTIVDETLSIAEMQHAVDEATEAWGAGPDAVIIDYVDFIPSSGDDLSSQVKSKMNSLKAWAKHATYPIIALHQGTRSNSHPGEPITLLSLGFSGEAQATIVLGARRKKDKRDLDKWEREKNDNTITLHLVKNKRPGGRCTHYEGIDFHLDPLTGLIRAIGSPSAEQAQQAIRGLD